MPLLANADVRNLYPGYNLPDSQLDVAMRIVAGWLREDTGRTDLSSELPDTDPLWPAAVELVGLLATNPELLASKTVGPTSRAWPIAQRRDAIRAAIRDAATQAASGPRGTFPPAPVYPDPASPPVLTGWWVWQ